MRGLLSLFRKEARDVRTLARAYALLAPVALLGVRWYLGMWYDGFATTGEAIPRHLEAAFPAVVWFFAAMVASDLVAGDVASRRIDQLALLPVRSLTVWTAKVAVLVGATLLMAAWAYAAQWGTLALVDGIEHATRFADRAFQGLEVAVVAAASIGAVLFVSTMGLRGIGAVLGGSMLCGLLGAAYAWGRAEPRWILGDDWIWVWVALAALWIGSAFAFVRGRVHLRERWRPAAIGAAALAALLGVPGAGLAAIVRHVAPDSSLCSLVEWEASPKGPWVALTYVSSLDTDAGFATFVLSLDDGTLRECETRGRAAGWQEDGTLAVQHWADDGTIVGALVDPATGRAVRPRTRTMDDVRADFDRIRKEGEARVWWNLVGPEEGGVWTLRRDATHQRAVRSLVRPGTFSQVTGDHRWFAVAPDADRLVKLDVESGEESPLATSPGLFDSASVHWPDEKGVVVVRAQRWFWLDFATGRAHEFPPEVKSVGLSMNAKGPGRLRSCGFGPREWGVADPVSGRFLRIVPGGDTIPLSLHDGGLALVRRDGTFERYDASLVRVEVKRHEVNR